MSVILDSNPGYPGPVSDTENRIYIHQQKVVITLLNLQTKLRKLGLGDLIDEPYEICAYIGQTNPDRDDKRLKIDGDYGKWLDARKADSFLRVHRELKDPYVREHFYSKGCRKNPYGGSHECIVAPPWIESYSEFASYLNDGVLELSRKFYAQEEIYGFTPGSRAKKIKEKNLEMLRAPDLKLVNHMIDLLVQPKDAMIYVPMDAYAHFCITLSNRGYTNIYTDKEYNMCIMEEYIPDNINFISKGEYESMDFDAVIGNPPFGKGGGLALRFLNSCADRVRAKDGQILLILPKSIKKGSSNFNKINRELELVSTVDCDPKDFASSIDACIQEWKIGETLRPLELECKEHPHLEFLSYERRYDADIFVGGDGEGSCGKVYLPSWKGSDGQGFTKYSKSSSHNYIKIRPDDNNTKDDIIMRLVSLGHQGDNTFRNIGRETTNGIPHLGKKKLITAYVNRYGNGHEE